MRSKRLHLFTAALVALSSLLGCTKQSEEFTSEPLSDYLPLAVGKYITYRLDSTVFTNFGTVAEVHSYEEKHIVDAQTTDAAGRTTYQVVRLIRDIDGTKPWAPAGTYFITPTAKTMEVVENNWRFVKLALPINQGFSWKGNEYLPAKPYSGLFNFSNDIQMEDWDYTIDSVNTTAQLNGNAFDHVIKITAANDVSVADTVNVNNTNQVQIPDTSKTVYLRGAASGPITIQAPAPKLPGKLFIYNRANAPAMLDSIVIPAGGAKSFEYINNKWTFGYVVYVDEKEVRKDTVFTDLPIGFKNIMVEKYAKNLGLVEQQLVMWEYQYSYSTQSGVTNGFGIRRSIIDHN